VSAGALAALALAGATVLAPARPGRGLGASAPRRRVSPGSAVAAGGGIAVAGAALLVPATVLVALAVLAGAGALRWRAARRAHRDGAARRALEAALEALVAELRIGAEPVAALAVAAADAEPGAVRQGLRSVAAGARLGTDVGAALRRLPSPPVLAPYWQRMATCWRVAHEHGVAIAPLLRATQRDLAARQRHADQVWAALAGTRATAAILALLPALGVALGELIGAQPLRFLLGGGSGGVVLVVGVGLVLLGVAWSDRLVAGVLA